MTSTEQHIPTLHEIAAMPFPASQQAMRDHYVKDWGKPTNDSGEKQTFKVYVRYSVTTTDSCTVEVEAFNEDEAEELAADLVTEEEGMGSNDFEIEDYYVLEQRR